ncbi:MAG TPA: hypothetical protein PKD61_39950, partial [Polyangiaceae bacterium]|nr:hypothetical protein [Polyangiaceae bacterium]
AGAGGGAGVGAAAGASGAGGRGGSGGSGKIGPLVVVTFNTGTSKDLNHDADKSDGYTDNEAKISDQQYGNGLSWQTAVDGTKQWLAALKPDIIVFQELFHSAECANIPSQFHKGFVCETWKSGDPTVVNVILGSDYQVACHLDKPDKCAAVKKSVGSFVGCSGDLCLNGLDGAKIPNCGGGSRVGRGTIQLASGGALSIVNVHGTSGFLPADQLCRVKQVEHVFVDMDGKPAANGTRNVVLGDLNTDPGRATLLDLSAQRWNDFVGPGKKFQFITAVGPTALPTYNVLNIDHVMSDTFAGTCWHAGVSPGHPNVLNWTYFDHKPAVCTINEL